MSSFNPALYKKTPAVNVLDNRSLTIREMGYHRAEANGVTDPRITRHQYDNHEYLIESLDPRLYDNKQSDASVKPNFSWQHDLTGQILSTDGVDAGHSVKLHDIEGRPLLAVTATDITQTWQYESPSLPGRLLSLTEQAKNTAPRMTERLFWADNSQGYKGDNLAGQNIKHYDPAGLSELKSRSVTGATLSQSRQLIPDNQQPDWTDNNLGALESTRYTTSNTIDATGATLSQTDAKGHIQRLAYDIAGQLKGSWLTVKGQSEQVIIKSLTYSAAGQKLREEHGNGVVTEYQYEPETQRLIGMTTHRLAGNKILQDLRYDYDPVGNVLSIRNDAEATRFWRNQKITPENNYTYDSLYQLLSATGREMANIGQQGNTLPPVSPLDNNTYTNYTRNYRYDRAGNLIQIRHSAPASNNNYTVDITVSHRSNHAVRQDLAEKPEQVDALFDAGGHQNMLNPNQSLNWNWRGGLQQVNQSGSNTPLEWYRYDSGNMRVLKAGEQQRVIYLAGLELRTTQHGNNNSEDLQVITVGEAGRAQVRVLHWDSSKPADIPNNQLRYSYDNLLGSSQLELDGSGQIITQEEYYPYGGTSVWVAKNQTEANYKTIRYSGKERDISGLYYYGYRYYQPWVGRWLSADPAGTVDGLNLYRMVRNNPISLFDPDGQAPNDANVQKVDSLKELARRVAAGSKRYESQDVVEYLGGIRELRGLASATAFEKAEEMLKGLKRKATPSGYSRTLSQTADVVREKIKGRLPTLVAYDEESFSGHGVSEGHTGLIGVPAKGSKTSLSPVLERDVAGNEVLFRTISQDHFNILQKTRKLSATTETSISPALAYSSKYQGVTVQFTLKPGTLAEIQAIGIAQNQGAEKIFPGMQKMSTLEGDWAKQHALFKKEGESTPQITTQLGKGAALDIFNANIIGYRKIDKQPSSST
ncbi:RHS repeat protein [Xenorhabdus entomophaga]|uniref:RHS repeat protein n=1 Tax=Xenorhabdus entomophaga TaxID=3136257 RepID=UPI0030F37626